MDRDYQSIKLELYPEIGFRVNKIYRKLLEEFEPGILRRILNKGVAFLSLFQPQKEEEEKVNRNAPKKYSYYGYLYMPSIGKKGKNLSIVLKLKPSPNNSFIEEFHSATKKSRESEREAVFEVVKLKKNYLEACLFGSGVRITGEKKQKYLFETPLMEFKWNCLLTIPGRHSLILEILWNNGVETRNIGEIRREIHVMD